MERKWYNWKDGLEGLASIFRRAKQLFSEVFDLRHQNFFCVGPKFVVFVGVAFGKSAHAAYVKFVTGFSIN